MRILPHSHTKSCPCTFRVTIAMRSVLVPLLFQTFNQVKLSRGEQLLICYFNYLFYNIGPILVLCAPFHFCQY